MMRLGERIRELRLRDGRTQEALANALGVTGQAVSRWEKGICYPDMELIPSIANCFGVSIDELFGYDNERAKKVDALCDEIDRMNRQNDGADVCIDACIALAREALIEFPGNEKLMLALASALCNAGYVRRGELHRTDADGFGVYDVERHRTYPEWQEAIKLYETLLPSLNAGAMRNRAVTELSQLYQNIGAHEKALALAQAAPELQGSRMFLRIHAFDGKDAVAASGEALLETVRASAERIVQIVLADGKLPPKTASDALQRAANLYDCICPDGDYGRSFGFLACMQMLRAYYLRLADDSNGAFEALDLARELAARSDAPRENDTFYSSPVLRHVRLSANKTPGTLCAELPDLWPWWDVPEYERVKQELQSDPRWKDWAAKCR